MVCSITALFAERNYRNILMASRYTAVYMRHFFVVVFLKLQKLNGVKWNGKINR
jgi:hypothetical protein